MEVLDREYRLTARNVQFYDGKEMKMKHKFLSDVCAETGVTRRAIQGYEQAGLVAAIGKNKCGYLIYDETRVERIRTIRFFQKIGFSIKEIQMIIDAPPDYQKEVLLNQIEKLEVHRKELSELIQKTQAYISSL